MSELPMSVQEAKAILAAERSIDDWRSDVDPATVEQWRKIVAAAQHRLANFTTDKRSITGGR